MKVSNLLPGNGPMTFGTPNPAEILRETVVAAIHDPATNQFMYQYWPEYSGLACLLSGGREPGEDLLQAIDREVKEETGFEQYVVVGQLGQPIHSHYFKPTTNEYFVKKLYPFLITLKSRHTSGRELEEDEKFDNIFAAPDVVVSMMDAYEERSGSLLEDHKEILARAMRYLGNS